MKKNMEYPYPERRRNAVIITVAAAISAYAIKETFQDNFKCEGVQTITARNNRLEDGSVDPNSHFTIWNAIDNYVEFNPETVNKQDIVQEIEDMNPNLDFGNIQEWDRIEMPLSCSDN